MKGKLFHVLNPYRVRIIINKQLKYHTSALLWYNVFMKCPKCNSENTEQMMYSLLFFEANEALGRDESLYGGSYSDEKDRYDYVCLDCGHKWKR